MASPRPARRSRARLYCEALEDRQLLAANPVASLVPLSPSDYRPDQILVQFQPGAVPAAVAGTVLGAPLSLVPGLYQVHLDSQLTVAQAVAKYQAHPLVTLAQPDYLVTAERVPNDPNFTSQWAFTNPTAAIKATTAWDTTVGSGQTLVAVIDTGIDYNHRDLAANLWRNTGETPGNGVDDDHNGFVDDVYGYNFVRNTGTPMDDNGHGTHVAGILGAVGNNGTGVAGVNWNVKIMALKFMDAQGRGATSDALRALNYAVQMGATISNNSWTSPAYDAVLEAGIRNAQAAGHIYVAAAGNTSQNLDLKKIYPAGMAPDNIVAVAALDSTNRLPSWSNWGPSTVAIAAPGSNIYSTLPGNRYGSMSGTSMATPFVTGAIALVRDLHPNWSYRQVIDQVLSTAERLTTLTGKVRAGKLNVAAAVGAGTPPPPPPPPAQDTIGAKVTGLATLIANNQIVGLRLSFNEPIQASTLSTADVLSLTGPAGPLTPTSVTPVAGSTTQFDVRFAGQVQTGIYAILVGTDIRDLAGNVLNQNGNGVNGENPADRYAGSAAYAQVNQYGAPGMPVALVDRGLATSPMVISDNMSIGSVRVQLTIRHTWMSDLVIKLRSPTGTEILLANRRGGGGKGYVSTVFDDKATQLISQGGGLFTGTYRPETPLALLNGQQTGGTWTLIVEDKAGGDTGTIQSWSLTFNQSAAGASSRTSATLPIAQVRRDIVNGLLRQPVADQSAPRPAPVNQPPVPQAPLAPALAITRSTQVQQQAQRLLTAWQHSVTTTAPLLQQLRDTILARLADAVNTTER